MLTKIQKEYLANMPKEKADKIVAIEPYNPKTKLIARKIMSQIKEVIPDVNVKFMGASALGISGLNDVDIWVLCPEEDKNDHLNKLSEFFRSRVEEKNRLMWLEGGISVSVKVADPKDLNIKGQLAHFNIFKKDRDLLEKYENLKISMNGKSYKEYATVKKDFLMRVYFANTYENLKNFRYLEKIGAAVTNSHLIKPTGEHVKTSFTKYKLYPHVKETFYVAKVIARQFEGDSVGAVVGTATGGDILSELVAFQIEKITKRKILSFYVKKDHNGNYTFRDKSNRRLIRGKRILLVDDALDTCKTVKALVSFVKNLGTEIIGVGVICTRNGILAEDLELPKFYTFINNEDKIYSYLPEDCPMCRRGIPINSDFGIGS